MRDYSLMIARFPGMNQEHPDSSGWVMSHMEKWLTDDRIRDIVPFKKASTPITMVRNLCIYEALRLNVDYVLMIDADMSPDCEPGAPPFWDTAWDFMMNRRELEDEKREQLAKDHGIVEGQVFPGNVLEYMFDKFAPATIAAPYCGPPPLELPYVFRWQNFETSNPDPEFRLTMLDRDHAARMTGITEVAALPTGLILYDTRVFRKLPPAWFKYEYTDQYQTALASTEDCYQTRNASLMGMPQFATWDCWAGHVKSKTVRKPHPLVIGDMHAMFAEAILAKQKSANSLPK